MPPNGLSSSSRAVASKANARAIPVLALDVSEACEALGLSWDSFTEHVAPEIRIVRLGRRKLIAVAELERFLAQHGHRIGV